MVDYAENITAEERIKNRRYFPEANFPTPEQEQNCTSVVCLVTTKELGSIALVDKIDSRNRAQLAFPGGHKLPNQTSEMAAKDVCFDKLDITEDRIQNIFPFWTIKKKQPQEYKGKSEYSIYYCVVLESTHRLTGSEARKDNPGWHPYPELRFIYKDLYDAPRSREVLKMTGMHFK